MIAVAVTETRLGMKTLRAFRGCGLTGSAGQEQQADGDTGRVSELCSLIGHEYLDGVAGAAQLPGGPAMSWYIHTRKP